MSPIWKIWTWTINIHAYIFSAQTEYNFEFLPGFYEREFWKLSQSWCWLLIGIDLQICRLDTTGLTEQTKSDSLESDGNIVLCLT